MIICICNNINDKEIKESVKLNKKILNLGKSCGKCMKCAKEILNHEKKLLDTHKSGV